jgi:16S rRNA (guanine527-N7)-methyltransferase
MRDSDVTKPAGEIPGVSRETSEQLALYAALVRKWSPHLNLVAPATLGQFETRHILDCGQIAESLPAFTTGIDIGSGAGLPGIVLALITRQPFTLIESDQRKASFLREAARVTQAPVTVLAQRAETAALAPASLVTARALAPLAPLLGLVHPLLAADGTAALMKGVAWQGELEDAQQAWRFSHAILPSRTQPGAATLLIRDLRPA